MKTLKDLVKEYAMFDTYECCGIPDYLRSAAREWIAYLDKELKSIPDSDYERKSFVMGERVAFLTFFNLDGGE